MNINMKTNKKLSIIATAFALCAVVSGCNDLLKEEPKSTLTPDYYSTGVGLSSGLTSVYSSFRNFYGNEGGANMTVYGTDEFTHGQQVSNPSLNVYNSQLNSVLGDITAIWNNAYPAINTCNGIIEKGALATDLTATQKTQLIAEAKYLRAHWYFLLVTSYGPSTLDLGSGPFKFNTNPTNAATRAPIADVWAAIISDLTDASTDLPDAKPSAAGHAWKASALHLLAKAYLTRGWSTASVAGDFQKALDAANQLIAKRSTYGVSLLPDYRTVFAEGNENNAEVVFNIQWLDNQTFNPNNGFASAQGQNRSLYFYRCLYTQNTPGMVRDYINGRPFVRFKPTEWTLETAFADKVNDTRYSKSFQTVWYANATSNIPSWTSADVAGGALTQKSVANVLQPAVAGQAKIAVGDTAIWLVPSHLTTKFLPVKDKRSYVMFFSDLTAGLPAGTAAATNPTTYYFQSSTPNTAFTQFAGYDRQQNQYFPSLSKYNATQFRAGNDANISSVRPFIVHRFSETYLIAAEAIIKGALSASSPPPYASPDGLVTARDYLNVVRARAGAGANGWGVYGPTNGGNGNAAALTAATPASPTIDYVLEERTRELCGEQMRWFDLVRTGTLISRVNLYNNYPANPGTWSVSQSFTSAPQNIPAPQPFHVLRPIPQGQIDGAVDPSQSNGKYVQNPGY